MDLFSAIQATVGVIKAVDHHTKTISDASKSLEFLKIQLDSTRKLLLSLEELVRKDDGDARSSTSHTLDESPAAVSLSRGDSILQSIEDEGQLGHLQKTLEDISTWLSALESKSRLKISLSRISLLSSKTQQKRILDFSSELREYKLTATLVLTMAMKYEH